MDTALPNIFKNAFTNIRFWILLFFIVRLIGITNPPLEVAHNWRQTTVTMSARNFLETDANILYPRIDIAGEKTGITGMEFPLLNYLIYLVSLVFGYAHWYGRLINLIISSIGLWYFFKLVKKYFTPSLAFNATFIMLFSIWFTYSRKIMPDTFSMSLLIIGLYQGLNYLDIKQSLKNLLLFFLFILLGTLTKLPSAYLLSVIIPPLFKKEIKWPTKLTFVLTGSLAMSLASYYYFVWVPHLTKQFGFEHFYMGTGLLKGFYEIIHHLNEALEKFYLDALQIVGFVLFLAGLALMIKNKNRFLFRVFLFSSLAYLILILKAGFAFYHHSYYIVPFAPVMALVAAYTLECIPSRKISILILMIVGIESAANKFQDFYIKDDYKAIIAIETELDKLGPRNELIFINSGNVPTPMYFAHRKGWVGFNNSLKNPAYIDSLKKLGLKRIVVLHKVFGESVLLSYPQVFQNTHFTIYSP